MPGELSSPHIKSISTFLFLKLVGGFKVFKSSYCFDYELRLSPIYIRFRVVIFDTSNRLYSNIRCILCYNNYLSVRNMIACRLDLF